MYWIKIFPVDEVTSSVFNLRQRNLLLRLVFRARPRSWILMRNCSDVALSMGNIFWCAIRDLCLTFSILINSSLLSMSFTDLCATTCFSAHLNRLKAMANEETLLRARVRGAERRRVHSHGRNYTDVIHASMCVAAASAAEKRAKKRSRQESRGPEGLMRSPYRRKVAGMIGGFVKKITLSTIKCFHCSSRFVFVFHRLRGLGRCFFYASS